MIIKMKEAEAEAEAETEAEKIDEETGKEDRNTADHWCEKHCFGVLRDGDWVNCDCHLKAAQASSHPQKLRFIPLSQSMQPSASRGTATKPTRHHRLTHSMKRLPHQTKK